MKENWSDIFQEWRSLLKPVFLGVSYTVGIETWDRDLYFLHYGGGVWKHESFLPSMSLLGSWEIKSHQFLYQNFLNGKWKSAQFKLTLNWAFFIYLTHKNKKTGNKIETGFKWFTSGLDSLSSFLHTTFLALASFTYRLCLYHLTPTSYLTRFKCLILY